METSRTASTQRKTRAEGSAAARPALPRSKKHPLLVRQPPPEVNPEYSTFDFTSGKPVPSYLANSRRKRPSTSTLLRKVMKERETENPSTVWTNAEKRSKGEKVLDDPKLLVKKLKREQKKRQTSAKKWSERKRQQESQQSDRQAKRQDHINERKARRQRGGKRDADEADDGAPKSRRPGFEGKRRHFLNSK
eukprot:TRINITY_DN901_c0_g1_i1.p1 TRINITY_DN901_c0_g1~~TRINITY_DN901_c0_g1_i1.p1  ORF type:complete len:192 (-),score=39.41 TRINITY_DN901_c0_g1_i1:111-686(-)